MNPIQGLQGATAPGIFKSAFTTDKAVQLRQARQAALNAMDLADEAEEVEEFAPGNVLEIHNASEGDEQSVLLDEHFADAPPRDPEEAEQLTDRNNRKRREPRHSARKRDVGFRKVTGTLLDFRA